MVHGPMSKDQAFVITMWSAVGRQGTAELGRLEQCWVTFRKMGSGAKIGLKLMLTDLLAPQDNQMKIASRLSCLFGGKAD